MKTKNPLYQRNSAGVAFLKRSPEANLAIQTSSHGGIRPIQKSSCPDFQITSELGNPRGNYLIRSRKLLNKCARF